LNEPQQDISQHKPNLK